MPGIVGIITRATPRIQSEAMIASMVAAVRHEHFYSAGTSTVEEDGIYVGWVAHPGSFAEKANLASSKRSIILIVAGECYRDDAEQLTSQQRDEHWIIREYRRTGAEAFNTLNGLFSGILIDRDARKVFLFNDRYGMERIYYHETPQAFYFASEAKALLKTCPGLRSFDEVGLSQYLVYGCTFAERTLFRGVKLLPGGSCWARTETTAWNKQHYFRPDSWAAQPMLSSEAFEAAFSELFPRILQRYIHADHQIGISLTAGLDTRMIMASAPNPNAVCYTYTGTNAHLLDEQLASQIARSCGLPHIALRIDSDFFSNFGNLVDRTVYSTDGTAGALIAHEIYFSQKARGIASVRLTGNFGSEVLRSMSTFKPSKSRFDYLDMSLGKHVRDIVAQPPMDTCHPVTFSAFREVPWRLFGSLAAGRTQLVFRTPYMDNELVALAYRAPQSSRQSPLPALRFIQQRQPMLARIPTDRGQLGTSRGPSWLARRLFAELTFKLDYLHKEGLPDALTFLAPSLDHLERSGFLGLHKFLAYRRWTGNQLSGYVLDVLTDAQTRRASLWRSEILEDIAMDHIKRGKNRLPEINTILTLDAIERTLFRNI